MDAKDEVFIRTSHRSNSCSGEEYSPCTNVVPIMTQQTTVSKESGKIFITPTVVIDFCDPKPLKILDEIYP